MGYRFGFAEDTVRVAASLEPALAARGVPGSVYVDNGSAFVDEWLLRACGKLGIRLVNSTPHRPQGRGKIERFFRTVNDQFLVEVHDTTAEDLAAKGSPAAAALLELNGLFTEDTVAVLVTTRCADHRNPSVNAPTAGITGPCPVRSHPAVQLASGVCPVSE